MLIAIEIFFSLRLLYVPQSSENTFDFIYLPVSWEIVFFFSNKQTTVGLTALAKNFLGMFCLKIFSDKEQKFYGGILSLVLVIFR